MQWVKLQIKKKLIRKFENQLIKYLRIRRNICVRTNLPLDEDPMVYHEEIVGVEVEVVRTLEYLRTE